MPNIVELQPHEVPEEHRSSFDYGNQFLGPSGNRSVLKITRACSLCNNSYEVTVANIRADLGRGRKMRLAKCKSCKGRLTNKDGYVWILKTDHPNAYSGKYVPEHILVMEAQLGRYLDTSVESVHHINGVRDDNVLENLQLRTRFHGAGQVYECQDCGGHNIKAMKL